MKNNHWTAISALAGVATLYLLWRQQQPLVARPLGLASYGPTLGASADGPNVAQLRTADLNSPTYAGYRKGGVGGFISSFVGALTGHTWGVKPTGTQSPSALPQVGIVPGQSPQNSRLITEATAQDSPSVSPDPDVVAQLPAPDDGGTIDDDGAPGYYDAGGFPILVDVGDHLGVG